MDLVGILALDQPLVYNRNRPPRSNAEKPAGRDPPSPARNSLAMADDAPPYDPLYLQGIVYFNDCDFFEAHETWEELWTEHRGPAREYYQGLIQAAVALHHFGNGNIRGAKKVYCTSCNYLEGYRPHYAGLDLEAFLAQYRDCFEEVLASTEEYPKIEIVPDSIPEIHLDTP